MTRKRLVPVFFTLLAIGAIAWGFAVFVFPKLAE